jgi:hypothetical protein
MRTVSVRRGDLWRLLRPAPTVTAVTGQLTAQIFVSCCLREHHGDTSKKLAYSGLLVLDNTAPH